MSPEMAFILQDLFGQYWQWGHQKLEGTTWMSLYLHPKAKYDSGLLSILLYSVLDETIELPNARLASNHKEDRPIMARTVDSQDKSMKGAASGFLRTSDILKSWLSLDHPILELREGDARTVIIRCAEEDKKSEDGVTFFGTQRGCVMTLYPAAFKTSPYWRGIDPRSHIDSFGGSLIGTLLHEFSHFLSGK